MSNDFDQSRMAAEVIIGATERALSYATEPAKRGLTKLLRKITLSYTPFLEQTHQRVGSIRTFLKPHASVDLLTHYVPVDLTNLRDDFTVQEIISAIDNGDRIVVSGLAGRGKSVFMKFAALSFYHAGKSRIPLFLELRTLNGLTTKNVLQRIHSQYSSGQQVTYAEFEEAISKGYFILILDGFDEISPKFREEIEAQIIDISFSFPTCPIIVSGRPYERFESWEQFRILHLKPMTLAQTRDLIRKSDYLDDVKSTFLERLDEVFFEEHESFLNTPLLAIMMMLTLQDYAEIPSTLHEFYRIAFDTLIRRHDAMKLQFLRDTHSTCNAEQMKRFFSSFCLLTYSRSKYTFNRDEILHYIDQALKQQGISEKPENLLSDVIESICLMQQEGFEISFVHRSFQEYFAAVFVASSADGLVKKYLNEGSVRIYDDVIPMLYGISPDRLESEWCFEVVAELFAEFAQNNKGNKVRLITACYPELAIRIINKNDLAITITDESQTRRNLAILHRVYPEAFRASGAVEPYTEDENWNDNIANILMKYEEQGQDDLAGFTAAYRSSTRNQGKTWRVYSSEETREFLEFLDLLSSAERDIRGLKKLKSQLDDRKNNTDKFLLEVFGNGN